MAGSYAPAKAKEAALMLLKTGVRDRKIYKSAKENKTKNAKQTNNPARLEVIRASDIEPRKIK